MTKLLRWQTGQVVCVLGALVQTRGDQESSIWEINSFRELVITPR